MTLPNERIYALQNTRQFLYDLLDPKKTPRVPRKVRQEARNVLKHYPYEYHLEELDSSCACGLFKYKKAKNE